MRHGQNIMSSGEVFFALPGGEEVTKPIAKIGLKTK